MNNHKIIDITDYIDKHQMDALTHIVDDIYNIADTLYYMFLVRTSTGYKDTCRLGSFFSHKILSNLYPEYHFKLRGGWDAEYLYQNMNQLLDKTKMPGGMFSPDNTSYCSHYWIESETYNFIIDFTANQFSYAKIFITDNKDDLYVSNLKSPYLEEEIPYSEIVLQSSLEKKNIMKQNEYNLLTHKDKFYVNINKIQKIHKSNILDKKSVEYQRYIEEFERIKNNIDNSLIFFK